MAKLSWEQVEHIREMKRNGKRFWGRRQLAKEYGISEKHMQKIANGNESWKV
jgi:DNA-binding Xre family transcriptional regulator